MKKHTLFCLFIITLLGIVPGILTPSAFAGAPLGEGWHLVKKNVYEEDTAQTPQSAVTAPEAATMLPSFDPPELTELARGLENDPRRIFEYVRNHYDYVPYYGYLKGPYMTYLDRAGNDMDLASLLFKLLELSGFSPEYVRGYQSIPEADLAEWLGVENDSQIIERALAIGSIPYVIGSPKQVERIWIRVNVDGTVYELDPAFKRYQEYSGIDLPSAAGYDRDSFLSGAGGTVGTDYVQNVGESAIDSELTGLAATLREYLEQNHFNQRTSEILGGREIIPVSYAASGLPTAPLFPVSISFGTFTDPPASLTHTIRVQHGGIDETLNIPDVAGRRLAFRYTPTPPNGSGSVASSPVTESSVSNPHPVSPTQEDSTAPVMADAPIKDYAAQAPSTQTTTWDFGYPVQNSSGREINWSYTNSNNVTIQMDISMVNDGGGAFYVSNGAGVKNVGPGQTYKVLVNMRSNTLGDHTGLLRFRFLYSGNEFGRLDATLKGRVVHNPNLDGSTSASITSFVDTPATMTALLKNSGSLPLTINSMSLGGSNPGNFSFISGNETGTLNPGQSRSIKVQYQSSSTGTHSADIQVKFTYDQAPWNTTLSLQGETTDVSYAQLWLDEEVLAEETASDPVNEINQDCVITVDHPHGSSLDQTSTYHLKRGSLYVVAMDFGSCHWGNRLAETQRRLDRLRAEGVDDEAPEMILAGLDVMGQTWMTQTTLADQLLARLGKCLSFYHHRVGIVAQETGYYVDVKQQVHALTQRSASSDRTDAVFEAGSMISSALEHGVLEQLQANRAAASTIKLLQLANGQGQKIFLADASNYASIRPQLFNYSTTDLDDFESRMADGERFVLPADGDIGILQWSGKGYIGFKRTETYNSIAMVIGGGFNGGYAGVPFLLQPIEIQLAHWGLFDVPFDIPPTLSREPVDLFTGAYTSAHTDLQVGNEPAPRSLAFSRNYDSKKNWKLTPMGYGWHHSWIADVQTASDAALAMARRRAADSAPFITAAYVILDLVDNAADNAKGWVVKAITSKWAVDQINNNAVQVRVNGDILTYVKQPDGTYAPPPGVTLTLSKTGDNYTLTERFGKVFQFTYNDGTDNRRSLTSITDVHGLTLGLTYNTSGQVATVADCWGRTLTFAYTGDLLTSVSDNTGRSIHFTFDDAKNLLTYSGPDGNTFSFTYDAEHHITEWRDPDDRVIAQNTYNALGQVTRQMSEGVHPWNFYFSGFRNVEEDPTGAKKTYLFDSQGLQTGFIDALGNQTSTLYNAQNQPVQTLDAKGNSSEFQYDAHLNLLRVTAHNGSETLETVSTYDALNRLISTIDPKGNETTFTYNAKHQRLTATNALNETTTWTYFPSGEVRTETDPDNHTTTYSYASYGQPDIVTRPDATTVNYDYNARGDLTAFTDARAHTETYAYNNRRLRTAVTDAHNHTSTVVYDKLGNPNAVTDRRGHTTTSVYDALNHLESTTAPIVGQTLYGYDSRDLQTSVTTPLGRVARTGYDAAGRVISLTTPRNNTSTFTLDPNGNRESSTDALDQTVTQIFDPLNRPTSSTNPRDETLVHAYDKNGNATTFTDGKNQTTHMGYDALNRQTSFTWPSGRSGSVTFNNRGLLATVTQPSDELTSFTYDSMGRLETSTDPVGTKTFTYDDNGNLLTLTEGSATLTRTYDALNRLASYTDASGDTIGYQYDEEGNLTQLTYPGGKTVTYTYDALNRLSTVTDWNDRLTSYTYDDDSRLTSITRPNGTLREIDYDLDGNVVEIREKTPSGNLIALFNQEFDAVEKIISELRVPKPSASGLTPLNGTSHTLDNQITSANGIDIQYDADGNMTSGPLPNGSKASYSFDARDRLTGAGGLTYGYDPAGHRTSLTDASGTTTYTFNPASALDQILIKTAPNGLKTYYVYGLNGLLYEETNGNTRTYHYDMRGSTVALTDDAATLTGRLHYSPYGQLLAQSGDTQTPFKFNGVFGVMTDANGLYHMRARYYHPILRRFISEDPSRFDGGNNFYAFAAGNPMTYLDPFGLGPVDHNLGSYLGDLAGGFFKDGLWGSITGLWDTVTHPIQTVKGLWDAATHPGSTLKGAWNGVVGFGSKLLSGDPETVGAGAFEVAMFFVPFDEIRYLKKVDEVADASKIARGGVKLSQKGLDLVESHLAQFGDDAGNAAMMQRLRTSLANGEKVIGADANFYLHEASEATMMGRGLGYDAAHAAALEKYGVSPFSLYHPDVILANPEIFSTGFKTFWRLE